VIRNSNLSNLSSVSHNADHRSACRGSPLANVITLVLRNSHQDKESLLLSRFLHDVSRNARQVELEPIISCDVRGIYDVIPVALPTYVPTNPKIK